MHFLLLYEYKPNLLFGSSYYCSCHAVSEKTGETATKDEAKAPEVIGPSGCKSASECGSYCTKNSLDCTIKEAGVVQDYKDFFKWADAEKK